MNAAGADGSATAAESAGANDIAIVGIATHLPGAHTPGEFWRNLHDGVESIVPLADDELLAAGVSTDVLRRPGYVKSAAVLDGVYDFDAEFFGFSPKEAGILDPQHRHFLMAVWEALEDAGHVPERFDGAVGVFAGCGTNSYYVYNILTNPDLVRDVGLFLLRHTGNDKDFLATRASYLFDLRGPAVNVQTACSTSLVATHLAVQHLLSGEVDLALAGGVTIEVPHAHGYQYLDGEILSPDGHCRAFDHRSQGTVFGSGVGVVALRRLDDALADGDHVYAVIKGTAVNNDGAQKVGYLAPSVDGQAACIAEALAVADVEPDSLSYVECHGTGTPMGDPIEVAALTQAFRGAGVIDGAAPPIGIGSVKTNIGHLDTAAGVAALAKVALSLHHGAIPPSLNFEAPNPLLELESSPFDVVRAVSPWPSDGVRRAGVNSLGVGGTNAFAVLEAAPVETLPPSPRRWRLVTLSARNRGALDGASARLAEHFNDDDGGETAPDLGDAAWTLYHGRRSFAERRVLVARDTGEAAELLASGDPRRVFSHAASTQPRRVALVFPGGGAQHLGMAAGLYAAEAEFRRHIDAGLDELQKRHGIDLREFLLDAEPRTPERTHDFELMAHQLPAIFLVEYALAQLLISWGVEFDALAGHSVGENTAACVAGTMTFSDCLGLVVLRGQLMDRVGGGAVAVPLPPDEVVAMADEFDLDLAVVNAPDLSVVSGELDVLARFEEKVRASGTEPQRVRLNVAAHSRVLDPILPEFRAYLESIKLSPPRVRWVSNRTGTWITDEQASDPSYWIEHLRNTVHFADCITTLAAEPGRVLLEVGPGKTLSSLARMNPELKAGQPAIPTMRHADEEIDDEAALIAAIGRLWASGYEFPAALEERLFNDAGRPHRRVSLPTYAFQTQRYFIAPGTSASASETTTYVDREPDADRWYWEPVWRSHDLGLVDTPAMTVLAIAFRPDAPNVAGDVIDTLRERGNTVVTVRHGAEFERHSDLDYTVSPANGDLDYATLWQHLVRTGNVPDRIVHMGLLSSSDEQFRPGSTHFHHNVENGFQSMMSLLRSAAEAQVTTPVHVLVTTMCAQHVVDGDLVQWPEQATVLGPALVASREFANVTVSVCDVDQAEFFPTSRAQRLLGTAAESITRWRRDGWRAAGQAGEQVPDTLSRRRALVSAIADEVAAIPNSDVVALRNGRRFVRDIRRRPPGPPTAQLRDGGVVLITGGLGGIGLTLAAELFETRRARLALMARTALPPRESWPDVRRRLGDEHEISRRIDAVSDLERRGAEVLLLDGDVADARDVRRVVDEIRATFGELHGVVHAAGVVDDALIVTKSMSDSDAVLAPKVFGTRLLDEATADDDLDLFVVFSSTSTVTTPVGQADYVAANCYLNSWVANRRAIGRDEVTAINWGIWNDVGMAATAAAPERRAPAEPAPTMPAQHPLFESIAVGSDGVGRLRSSWTVDDWFLDEHRTEQGEALLPGSAYVELARAALAELDVDQPFEIRDLTFLRPLGIADNQVGVVETVLIPTGAGYDLTVRLGVELQEADAEGGATVRRTGWYRVASATLLLRALDAPDPIDLAETAERLVERDTLRTRQQDHLRFGPRWDVVTRVQRSERSAIAWLELPEQFATDLDDFDVHPALMDLGTGFAMNLIGDYVGDTLWVPLSYRSIRVLGVLPRQCVAVATVLPASSERRGFARFNVDLCAPDGTVAVSVREFTIKRLDGPLDTGIGRQPAVSDLEFDEAPAVRAPSPAEIVLRHNLEQGIRPTEGRQAFLQALGTGAPVVYVSSMDLPALRRQAAGAGANEDDGAGSSAVFARPSLSADYVAPRDEREAHLVTIWEELLGIDELGINDDFFELGGHSLIAVRLFARVKKTFSVEFPISVLFEAPTIASLSALIGRAQPSTAETSDTVQTGLESSLVASPAARYRHLVTMHPGEAGARTPIFVVAGMGGNVLNLRYLAQLIGTDRPFYGVQARGVIADDAPFETFEEMAATYLEEIRSVQPDGPYMLGGFSGGGIAAYEMAQQLAAVGQSVSLLVMLDTPLPFDRPLRPTDRLKIQRDNFADQGLGYLKTWAVNRYHWERQKRLAPVDVLKDRGDQIHERVERAFLRALERYEIRPLDATVTLYRPRLMPTHTFGEGRRINVDRRFIFEDNGWSEFVPEVDVNEVPGDHDSMVLEPHVRVLARLIREAIESAESRVVANSLA